MSEIELKCQCLEVVPWDDISRLYYLSTNENILLWFEKDYFNKNKNKKYFKDGKKFDESIKQYTKDPLNISKELKQELQKIVDAISAQWLFKHQSKPLQNLNSNEKSNKYLTFIVF